MNDRGVGVEGDRIRSFYSIRWVSCWLGGWDAYCGLRMRPTGDGDGDGDSDDNSDDDDNDNRNANAKIFP